VLTSRSRQACNLGAFAVVLLAAAISSPILYKMILTGNPGDYGFHLDIAAKMQANPSILTPHFLYQLVTIFIRKLLHINDIYMSGFISAVALEMLMAFVLFRVILRKTACTIPTAIFLSISLMIVIPAAFLVFKDHHLYFGYIGVNVYHNPTITALKPFAILLFFLTADAIDTPNQNKYFTFYILINILSLIAKPSYAICLIPAVFCYVIYLLIQKKSFNHKWIIGGLFLPTILILIFQFYIAYASERLLNVTGEESKIIFAPLEVMRNFSPFLLPKFFMSFIFPFAVGVLYFKKVIRDKYLVISWTAFGFGSAYTYIMAESGRRLSHGNFLWSGQICLLILFVTTMLFLINEVHNKYDITLNRFDAKGFFCFLIYGVHVIFGGFYYFTEYTKRGLYW
jgi:hypothetical protein